MNFDESFKITFKVHTNMWSLDPIGIISHMLYMYVSSRCNDKETTATPPTKPSSSDDTGVRHDFIAKTEFWLILSTPPYTPLDFIAFPLCCGNSRWKYCCMIHSGNHNFSVRKC